MIACKSSLGHIIELLKDGPQFRFLRRPIIEVVPVSSAVFPLSVSFNSGDQKSKARIDNSTEFITNLQYTKP